MCLRDSPSHDKSQNHDKITRMRMLDPALQIAHLVKQRTLAPRKAGEGALCREPSVQRAKKKVQNACPPAARGLRGMSLGRCMVIPMKHRKQLHATALNGQLELTGA